MFLMELDLMYNNKKKTKMNISSMYFATFKKVEQSLPHCKGYLICSFQRGTPRLRGDYPQQGPVGR